MYSYYNAYLQSATPSSVQRRSDLQALVNEQFEDASTLYTIFEENSATPATPTQLTVRINHMINIDTGARLGDDWRKIIFKDFSHPKSLGRKYYFDNYTWLTINMDIYKSPTAAVNIRRCNWALKWYDDNGIYREEDCIVEYVKMIASAMGILEGRQMREGTYDRFIYLANNEHTINIKRDQRFFIDKLVFKVTKIDTIAHNGLIELSLDEHQINTEVDDMVNYIADATTKAPTDNSNVGTTEGIYGASYISTGTWANWVAEKKINGVQQVDAYTFTIVGTGATISSFTPNSVTILAGQISGGSFQIEALNTTTLVVLTKTINITGMW